MNDASEVLYTLYESINAYAGAASPVDAIFGLSVKEGVHCHCGKETHKQVRSPAPSPPCSRTPPAT